MRLLDVRLKDPLSDGTIVIDNRWGYYHCSYGCEDSSLSFLDVEEFSFAIIIENPSHMASGTTTEYINIKRAIERGYKLDKYVYSQLLKSMWGAIQEGKCSKDKEVIKKDINLLAFLSEHGIKDHIERTNAQGCYDLFIYLYGENTGYIQTVIEALPDMFSVGVISMKSYTEYEKVYKDIFFRAPISYQQRVNPLNHCEEIKTYLELLKLNL